MAHYKWQTSMYPAPQGPIWAGIISGDTSEHSTDVLLGGAEATFGYLDSNVVSTPAQPGANNTSRVIFTIDTSWDVVFDSRNNMTVTISSTLVGMARDMVVGNPAGSAGYGRNIRIYNYQGGPQLWHYYDANINQAKTIAEDVPLTTYTLQLAPGESASTSSMYIWNKTAGVTSPGDHIYVGVRFTNDMPPDYRPGAILENGVWQSHNRNDGESHILCNGRWNEMRTDNGHTENDNPPSMRMNDRWTDQLLLGKEN